MGNNTSCGFGVVNNTKFNLTVRLSMGATHYFENDIRPGQVFYRWPGAVWYTVDVYPSELGGRMTRENWAKEIGTATCIGVGSGLFVGLTGGWGLYAVIGAMCFGLTSSILALYALGGAVVGGAADGRAAAGGAAAGGAPAGGGRMARSIFGSEVIAVNVEMAPAILAAVRNIIARIYRFNLPSEPIAMAGGVAAAGAAAGGPTAGGVDNHDNHINGGIQIAQPTFDVISKAFECAEENSPVSIQKLQEMFRNAGWEVSKEATSSLCKSSAKVIKIAAMQVIQTSKMVHVAKGKYGGGNGTWLEVCGLPYVVAGDDGEYRLASQDIELKDLGTFAEAKQKFFDHGFKLTDISYEKYNVGKSPNIKRGNYGSL